MLRPSDRRLVRIAVGLLWTIAGALQLQPFMFTRGFAVDVLGTAALAQPPPLGWAIRTFQGVVGAHPAAWNWLFALAELAIGVAMAAPSKGRLLRSACWASVAFATGVWVLGEGAGGLLNGTAALSTGAPGAALLYVALTALGWPSPNPLDARLAQRLWTAVWALGAALVFVPAQWGARGLASQAAMGWMMSPHWTAGTAYALARTLKALPPALAVMISLTTAATYLVIGVSPYFRGRFAVLGAAVAIGSWVYAQGFGGISTGTATDVGSGPVLVVLACVVLSVSQRAEPPQRRARTQQHEAHISSPRGVHRNRPAHSV